MKRIRFLSALMALVLLMSLRFPALANGASGAAADGSAATGESTAAEGSAASVAYTSSDRSFCFNVPEGWFAVDSIIADETLRVSSQSALFNEAVREAIGKIKGTETVALYPQNAGQLAFYDSINVRYDAVPAGLTNKALLDIGEQLAASHAQVLAEWKTTYPCVPYTFEGREVVLFGGEGVRSDGIKVVLRQVLFIVGARWYQITLSCAPERVEQLTPSLFEVARTFQTL